MLPKVLHMNFEYICITINTFFAGSIDGKQSKNVHGKFKSGISVIILKSRLVGMRSTRFDPSSETKRQLSSVAFPWVDPRDAPGEPARTQGVWYSFGISRGRGELFSFGNDFTGPRGHTHGIC